MSSDKIDAPKINRPIQLLAAWLSGLVITNASFLGAAAALREPQWGAGALVIAAILNVPLFMACIFLLQTKFRPEMQEDAYYSTYLERRYSADSAKSEFYLEKILNSSIKEIPLIDSPNPPNAANRIIEAIPKKDDYGYKIQINDLLIDYEEIRSEIENSGLRIWKTFGSTSDTPSVPKPFIMSMGRHVPVEAFQKSLSVLLDRGLEGLAFSPSNYNDGFIYIGAYAYGPGERPYAKISEDLIKKIMRPDASNIDIERAIHAKTARH
jgi:hypothetical protein